MKNTMKKSVMLLVLAVLVVGGVFAQKVGDSASVFGSNWTVQSVSGDTVTLKKAQGTTFTSIAAFKTWFDSQPNNTAANPYNVKINISNMGGQSGTSGSLGNVLLTNENKYVNLDLSGSTFTSVVRSAFNQCKTLTGLTIGNNVTEIVIYAFQGCDNLTSVTFQGTIPSSGFGTIGVFPGDIRTKFYATDKTNGTPGTYTRTGSGTSASPYVWTKQ